MSEEDLLCKLIEILENKGYIVKDVDLEGGTACINTKYKICAYDCVLITPFSFAHEIIHAKFRDTERKCDFDALNPCEKRANKEAILLLWKLFQKEGGKFSDFPRFIQITGCPADFAKLTILRATTKEYTRNEVEEKVTDYLMHTDEEPETWNKYRIMDALRINRQWELIVAAVITKIGYNLIN